MWIQDFQGEQQVNDIKNLLLHPGKDLKFIKRWCDRLAIKTFDLLPDD